VRASRGCALGEAHGWSCDVDRAEVTSRSRSSDMVWTPVDGPATFCETFCGFAPGVGFGGGERLFRTIFPNWRMSTGFGTVFAGSSLLFASPAASHQACELPPLSHARIRTKLCRSRLHTDDNRIPIRDTNVRECLLVLQWQTRGPQICEQLSHGPTAKRILCLTRVPLVESPLS
jgi:hypothetical protein